MKKKHAKLKLEKNQAAAFLPSSSWRLTSFHRFRSLPFNYVLSPRRFKVLLDLTYSLLFILWKYIREREKVYNKGGNDDDGIMMITMTSEQGSKQRGSGERGSRFLSHFLSHLLHYLKSIFLCFRAICMTIFPMVQSYTLSYDTSFTSPADDNLLLFILSISTSPLFQCWLFKHEMELKWSRNGRKQTVVRERTS